MSNDIDNLVKIISKLKTLGPKSARRIVLQLLDNKIIKIQNLWLNDVLIPRLSGKPIIDDDTSEPG